MSGTGDSDRFVFDSDWSDSVAGSVQHDLDLDELWPTPRDLNKG